MGKRKERRLAARTSAGRRVKLDLFAEPSGDSGGSAENDELGGDKSSNGRAGLPNSPSSSGQKTQNPLLLLGQYSDDDESDNDSNQVLSNAAVVNCSRETNAEVKSLIGESRQHLDTDISEDFASQKVKKHGGDTSYGPQDCDQNMEDSDKRENDQASNDLRKDLDITEQIPGPETSSAQVIGDVSSGWKIVMHEESNSYYYWNIETGETSWEVPNVLAQETKLTDDQRKPTVAGETDDVPVGTQESNLTSGWKLDGFSNSETIVQDANMVPDGKESFRHGCQMDELNVGCSNEDTHDTMTNEDHESRIDLSSRLVKHCEDLLERLKPLKGPKDQLQGLDLISKYSLEVEMRLSDVKALLSYGQSLLPFWLHSERQLKQLESAINDETSKIVKSVQLNGVEVAHSSFSQGENSFQESMECKVEADRIRTFDDCHVTLSEKTISIDSKDQGVKYAGVNAEPISACSSPMRNRESGTSEHSRMVVPDECTTKNEVSSAEDVDMDVDMEIEDPNSADDTAFAYALNAKEFSAVEQPIHPSQPPINTSLESENMFTGPPPPDEEWIPPPPPDIEQVPPPPPDDPPCQPPYPLPSYPESQPMYAEQYSISYPNSSYGYYGHPVSEAPNTIFYGNPEGCQVAIAHGPLYYGAAPSTYTETAQVVPNPVESVTYYGLQHGAGPAAPLVNGLQSLQFHSESVPLSYDNLVSDPIGSINSFSAAGSSGSLPTLNIEHSAVDTEANGGPFEAPLTTDTIQAPATSLKNTVPVTSTDSVPTAASISSTSVVDKVQSKVPRTKKRTVAVASSLRSNKKVSSLVDKWKAAKEEMLEDEEEPENAYELFERKRQRGIEEWYAQQINSGEAKDNANFQPLGGDWREKVKRRKTQLAREAAKAAPAPAPEASTDGNHQPDLTAHSRDLPSGWQAYWDEPSKQVYYVHIVTSETTWTKPTK